MKRAKKRLAIVAETVRAISNLTDINGGVENNRTRYTSCPPTCHICPP